MQKFQIRGWTLVMMWIVTAGVIWLFASVWPSLNGWLKEQQHLSGWAQAAGVIITVTVGFIAIQHQIRAAHELEAEKRRRDFLLRTEIVYTLLGNVLDAINEAERGLFVQPLIDISGRVGALDRAAAALESLPPLEIPGPRVAIEVVQLPARVRRLAKHVARIHEALAETYAHNLHCG